MKKKLEETVGVGRRKRAVASVRLRKGKGVIDVNGKQFDEYFPSKLQREAILAPLVRFELENKYDLLIRANGGGIEAQVIAVRLGISRALVIKDEDHRHDLKELGFLTRDPRRKERKKYGLAKARKGYQFSKR